VERPSRELLHMMTAVHWSLRSVCKRPGGQVGCVITSGDLRRILSFGYNGPAKGLDNNYCRNKTGACGCLHAEDNAITFLRDPDQDPILFSTCAPCENCAQRIVQAGISKVYFLRPYRDTIGLNVLDQCRVRHEQMQLSADLNTMVAWLRASLTTKTDDPTSDTLRKSLTG